MNYESNLQRRYAIYGIRCIICFRFSAMIVTTLQNRTEQFVLRLRCMQDKIYMTVECSICDFCLHK